MKGQLRDNLMCDSSEEIQEKMKGQFRDNLMCVSSKGIQERLHVHQLTLSVIAYQALTTKCTNNSTETLI